MKKLMLLALLAAAVGFAKEHTVWLSYYGTSDFDVQPAAVHLEAGDVIHYRTDGPGTLFLRLDSGKVYHSDSGEITLTADQVAGTRQVRCSMLLEDGSLVGWEVDHDNRMGHDIDLGPSQASWLLSALIALSLL